MSDGMENWSRADFKNAYLESEQMANRMMKERNEARAVLGWVEAWVSNPIGSYSISALDGLFGMTRDKIAALAPHEGKNPK